MSGDLDSGVGHVHDLGTRRPVPPAELTIAKPEVERRAHDNDQVSLAECHGTSPSDE